MIERNPCSYPEADTVRRDEQLRRFEQRLDDPARRWKISEADYSEREYWTTYEAAHEDGMIALLLHAILATSKTRHRLAMENLALRHQIRVLRRPGKRPYKILDPDSYHHLQSP
jgi:hypothetical protein